MSNAARHQHQHQPNRFAVIPTPVRLKANKEFTGKGVRIAFLDSGFYPHSDLFEPINRLAAYKDVSDEYPALDEMAGPHVWQWHGTQTAVAAAGNGYLSNGTYRGVASDAELVLIKVSQQGKITEDGIARGINWAIENRKRLNIRILNISLSGDDDVPCSRSIIDQAAEQAIRQGIVVVVAAGNSGHDGKHSIPPANSPSVITVGGYSDHNQLDPTDVALYHSNFGFTADGTVKPEVIAPAMWVAAPILPGTNLYTRAEVLSLITNAPDYQLPSLAREHATTIALPGSVASADSRVIRDWVEEQLRNFKIVAAHYQHVDGTSFAAPIVSSVVAQMLEANPRLSPATVKSILIATAERLKDAPVLRQGYGVINASAAVALAQKEKHQLDAGGCESIRPQKDRIVFSYHNDFATSVTLAGNFNDWNTVSTPFMKEDSGIWITSIASPGAGRYEYKFLVNGQQWVEDPNNGLKVPDNFGGLNSLFIINES